MYSEGKINIKAGDPLWPKNLSLLIFSERKFSVSSKILVSQTTSHIVYFFLAMVALFSYIVHFANRLCYNVFFRKFNIKGLSCLFIFPPCKFCEIFAKKYLQICSISSLTTNYILSSKKTYDTIGESFYEIDSLLSY